MFSSINALGDVQAEVPEWYGVDDRSEGDVDFISTQMYSPDAGYPPKRIGVYDEALEQHETLNGPGFSRTVAPFRGFFGKAMLPLFRTYHGGAPVRPAAQSLTPAQKAKRLQFSRIFERYFAHALPKR